MNLVLSHNPLWYTGVVSIFSSEKSYSIFESHFTCGKEEEVINVLRTLELFGTRIREFNGKLNRELESATKI